MTVDQAHVIALQVLVLVGGDEGQLNQFMARSGMPLSAIEEATNNLSDPRFLYTFMVLALEDDEVTPMLSSALGMLPEQLWAAARVLGKTKSLDMDGE